jgi:hypothetical protein
MNVQFRWGFWAKSWDFSDLRFPYAMFTLQTSFKPLLLKGEGGVKSVSIGDCEWQGGKLWKCYPKYVREFGFWRISVHTPNAVLFSWCFYITVDPEPHTHQTEFDVVSFPSRVKPILFRNITIWLLSSIYRRAVVKQHHYMANLLS